MPQCQQASPMMNPVPLDSYVMSALPLRCPSIDTGTHATSLCSPERKTNPRIIDPAGGTINSAASFYKARIQLTGKICRTGLPPPAARWLPERFNISVNCSHAQACRFFTKRSEEDLRVSQSFRKTRLRKRQRRGLRHENDQSIGQGFGADPPKNSRSARPSVCRRTKAHR
ncbi:hypothetical protein J6590_095771 [Homalodisca vitripennis]|nr:hypothetical protein J6590_095771 [Homalodisca vitripennis]